MTEPKKRDRNFCITDFETFTFEDIKQKYPGHRYICGALETCPTTGKQHFQMVVCYENARTIQSLGKKRKNNVEPMHGHIQDAAGYCAKGNREKPEGGWRVYLDDPCEGFEEEGDMPHQGARTDLGEVTELLNEGKKLRDIAETHAPVLIKYPRGMQLVRSLLIKPRDGSIIPEVRVYWGATGTGKTLAARTWLPDAYVWTPDLKGWWEGYDGEEDVIFEEFRGSLMFSTMLMLLDRNSAKVPVKGGHCEFRALRIAICSPLPPESWYPNKCSDQDSLDQLMRRITSVEHMT